MLPLCERVVNVPRKHVRPLWTRSMAASKQPETIGEHLRKKRFDLGIRQTQAALRLGVSAATLSHWECNRIIPTWPYHPVIVGFLGYDPFTDPNVGRPGGNKP